MTARLTAVCAFACLGLVLGGSAAATTPVAAGPSASAHGLAIVIIGPDGSPLAATTQLEAPPATSLGPAPFGYSFGPSSISAGSTSTTVAASTADATASATVTVVDLSLFDGEITASEVRASISATAQGGDLSDSTITNLIVGGQSISEPSPGLQVPLADWGTLTALGESAGRDDGSQSWRGSVAALSIHLDLDHLGLPKGTTIRVGLADAYAKAGDAPSTTTTTRQAPAVKPGEGQSAPTKAKVRSKPAQAQAQAATGASIGVRAGDTHRPAATTRRGGLPVLAEIPAVTPKLTAGGYVFPVYGPSAYGDTFGAPRGDVSGGWHHGDDIFAPLGAPLLAVADGTVFSVGWNDIGGYRLWLRDRGGNEFYYAHLSAYTTLAVNGRHVQAGDVLGFVGNTGDAQGTPFHVHFEVHPVSLLFLGYDGAVNPTQYLNAWKRLEDVRILPAVPFSSPASGAEVSSAPTPGAILLKSTDISTADGLVPGSLARALNAPTAIDVTKPRVAELPVPLPVLDRA